MKNFKDILRNYMEIKAITQNELAEILGESQQSVSDFLKKDGNPQKKTKDKYFEKLSGFKVFFENTSKKQDSEVIHEYDSKKKSLEFEKFKLIDNLDEIPEQLRSWVKPFYPEMKVGAGLELGNFHYPTKYFILVPFSEKVEFWVPVEGYSMFPKYGNGDLVGLSEVTFNDVFPGNNYVVSYKEGSAHLKRIEKGSTAETIILRSYNPENADKEEKIENLAKFFKVKMSICNE